MKAKPKSGTVKNTRGKRLKRAGDAEIIQEPNLTALEELRAENARLRESLEMKSREGKLMATALQKNKRSSNKLADTAPRQAEAVLQFSHAQLESIFNSIMDGIISIGDDQRIVYCVWLSQGVVAKGADKDLVQRKFEDYRRTKYHKVSDEIQPDWDLRGVVQIVDWARGIVAILQERRDLPQFAPTSSFRRELVN